MRWPSVRATRGSFSGPITMSATSPMTRSSENPMSNIAARLENKKALELSALGEPRTAPSGLVLGFFLDFAFDGLAGHLRRGARLGRLIGCLANAVLEAAYRATQVSAHVAQL